MAHVLTLLEHFPFTFLDACTVLVFVVTFVIAVRVLVKTKRPGTLPPLVPGGWPLLHHLPTLFRTDSRLQLDKWAREIGDVYHVRFFRGELCVVSGYEALKEMMEKEEFSTRNDDNVLAATEGGQDILLAPYGEVFKERRRFATSVFRRLGVKMGRGSIQDRIQEEACYICVKISGYGEQPFDVSADLTTAAGNIICALVFGKRFDYGDTRFQHLQTTMKNLGAEMVKWIYPFVTYIPKVQDPFKGLRFHAKKLHQFIREEIDRHRLNLDPENPRDFIDYCLLQLARQDGSGTWLNEDNMVYIILDLFIAGTDTTAATLTWALLYMILYPDVQQKVQAELDSVLGATKPSLAHRDQLPFTTATIMEAQRIRHVVPLMFGRKAAKLTSLRGFDIAEGTFLIPNLRSVHMDPAAWPDPEVFDPSRFLDGDGKVVNNPPSFLPFSTGRRNCLGEQLAKMELFLLFSTILQHFALKLPEGAPTPSTEGTFKSLSMGPAPFQLCAVPR
ncbi:cytochrome P450 2U1-like [Branchiostoma floridae]|uniref:Cytochrome P450 2U1-like n=1 Tax=Branchiostoma floridae TaxID=7739 RepID=A0A9J7KXZ9_BRAFL|nr:cytochrome P450 2U1-like [Branchiostoma floridae]